MDISNEIIQIVQYSSLKISMFVRWVDTTAFIGFHQLYTVFTESGWSMSYFWLICIGIALVIGSVLISIFNHLTASSWFRWILIIFLAILFLKMMKAQLNHFVQPQSFSQNIIDSCDNGTGPGTGHCY